MGSRTYDESCALAHGLDLVGDRWTLLVVRELMFGPRRFTDIQARLSAASSSVLTDRLQRLVETGVAERRRLPAPAASWVYQLTDRGRELRPAMIEIARWGLRSPSRQAHLTTTPAATAMAMLLHFDPSKAQKLKAAVDLDLDGDRFRAEVGGGALDIGPPRETPAPALIRADAPNLKALVAPQRPDAATGWVAQGIQIEGDEVTAVQVLKTLTADPS